MAREFQFPFETGWFSTATIDDYWKPRKAAGKQAGIFTYDYTIPQTPYGGITF